MNILQHKEEAVSSKPNSVNSLWARLETYEDNDPAPFGPLIIAFCLYAFIVLAMGSRALWFDELCTYYIAKAPTIKQLIVQMNHLDLQPPMQYVLSRISLSVLGNTNLAARLPDIIAFTIASVCIYLFVRRRLGRFYGLTAMLVFWLAPFLQYATEARPYALVVGFLGISMLGWQAATTHSGRRLGIFAIGFGVWGMILSHAFSPLVVAVLGFAELVRSINRRHLDWSIWIALVVPSPFVIVYLPMFHRFQGWTAIPPEFKASPFKMISFYVELLSSVSVVLLIALIAALMLHRSAAHDGKGKREVCGIETHEIALALGLLSLPIPINLVLMRSGGAFWSRYCISSAIGFSIVFVYILAKLTAGSRATAAVVSWVILSGIALGMILQITRPQQRAMVTKVDLKQLDPPLPLVDASGLTFLEMNKREDPSLMAHVFYLTDHDAALHYAHATIFEGAGVLKDYWPIHGTVEPYRDFIRQNPHFFLLGTPDYPEDWLIPKLLDDGADLQFKGELQSSYKDNMMFEVTLPSPKPQGTTSAR